MQTTISSFTVNISKLTYDDIFLQSIFHSSHTTLEIMLKGRPLQYLAACLGLLNMFCSGFHLAWPSPFLPVLEHDPDTGITKDEGSWIATIYLLISPIGSIMASVLMDKIGRKNSLLCAAIPYLISWVIIGLTQRLGFLLLARCIGGIGDGVIYTILPVYIAEIADPQIRGFIISFVGILAIFGGLLINVYGYYLNIAYSSLLCAIPSSIFIIFFYFLPETPNYYIVRKNVDRAREVLSQISGRQIAESEIEELIKINEEGLVKASIFDLFRVSGNRRGLFIYMGTMTTQQFSGIIPIMFYTQTIFEEAAADFPVIASTVLLYVVLIIFSSVSAVIVDRLGRRPLIITSTALSCLFLLTEGVNLYIKSKAVAGVGNVGFSWVTIVDLSFLIVSFSIGLLSIPTVFQGEFFPLNVKAAAVSFCNIYFAVMASIAAKLFQITNDKYGLYVPFFMFSVVCGLGLVFAVIFVPETKNKTLEEIQIELKALNIDAKNVN